MESNKNIFLITIVALVAIVAVVMIVENRISNDADRVGNAAYGIGANKCDDTFPGNSKYASNSNWKLDSCSSTTSMTSSKPACLCKYTSDNQFSLIPVTVEDCTCSTKTTKTTASQI